MDAWEAKTCVKFKEVPSDQAGIDAIEHKVIVYPIIGRCGANRGMITELNGEVVHEQAVRSGYLLPKEAGLHPKFYCRLPTER